ncbi:MAG TPA: glycosyl hydrolase family 28-related protein [Acidobacteriaceae bacterium]
MISIVLGISKASARRGVLYHASNSTGAQDNLLQVKKNAGQRRIYRGIPVGISLLAFGLLLGALHAQGVESQAGAVAGANTPFVTLEAEAGKLGGGATIRAITPGMPVPNEATLELEASGHSLVELKNDGESVSWLNNTGVNANSIVIRASIPDAPTGGGITATIDLYVDGVFRQTITLSSRQSWTYQNPAGTNLDDPTLGGKPYKFYNEDRAWITGEPIAPGSTITLQVDSANTASVYDIDCIDLQSVPSPLTQPTNSLSIVAYGADPTFTTDSTSAIQKSVNDARTQGKSVWIPAGKYLTNSLASGPLDFTGVTVNGAGMWYSMIYRKVPLPPPSTPWRSYINVGSGTTLRDISIDSNAIYRSIGRAGGDDYGIQASGAGGWLIERVWVQHCDANWLSGSNGTIRDSRVADSWGDGINLNNGNTPNPDKLGFNLTVQNSFVRGAGDDGIATYSDSGSSGTNSQMDGTEILNNTSVAPWWANGMRIAGGRNVVLANNLVNSVSANNALEISVFGNTGQPLESAIVEGNVLIGGGGWNGTDRHGVHVGSPSSTSRYPSAYTAAAIINNFIRDSLRAGLKIGTTYENLIIINNTIDHPAAQGIWISSGVTGTGRFAINTVTNLLSGRVAFQNDSPNTFTVVGQDPTEASPFPMTSSLRRRVPKSPWLFSK